MEFVGGKDRIHICEPGSNQEIIPCVEMVLIAPVEIASNEDRMIVKRKNSLQSRDLGLLGGM